MKKMITCTMAIIMVLMSLPLLAQDFIITDANGSTQYISDGWMKDAGEDQDFIFNLDKDIIIIVDHQLQKYASGTMDDYCNASKKMIQTMMEGVPPEQWEMMVQMQKTMPVPKVEVKSAGNGGTIAGFSTEKYQVLVNGDLYEEVWITTDSDLQEVIDLWRGASDMGSDMIACASLGEEFMGKDPQSTEVYRSLESKGVVLKSINHEYGMAETDSEVISIEETRIDGSEFKPPADYQKMNFEEFVMSQMNQDEDEY